MLKKKKESGGEIIMKMEIQFFSVFSLKFYVPSKNKLKNGSQII